MGKFDSEMVQPSNTYDKTYDTNQKRTEAGKDEFLAVYQTTIKGDEIENMIKGLEAALDKDEQKATVKLFISEREGSRGTFLSSFLTVGPTVKPTFDDRTAKQPNRSNRRSRAAAATGAQLKE